MTTGARIIAYHAPLAPSFGDRFEATMTNREVMIGLGSRRFQFTMRSSRFHRSARRPRRAGEGYESTALWRVMGYLGCASLALGLVFVSGSVLRAAPPVAAYAVVMPIGDKAAPATPRHKAKPRRAIPVVPTISSAPAAAVTDVTDWSVEPAFDAGDGTLTPTLPSPDVATLPTTNGERAVAVYGPSRRVGGKSCRDVSVFVRGTDNKVSVSPTLQCDAAR
jgi:hypothetical protein